TVRYLSRDLSRATEDRSVGTPRDPEIDPSDIIGIKFLDTIQNQNQILVYQDPSNLQEVGRYRVTEAGNNELRDLSDQWHYGGFQHDPQSGVAGWNDESGVSAAAREVLKRAAGISPPPSEFVLQMLAVYLIVLVPVNWLVFWLIGRVEWAWIAAPFIAIAGAFMVAKMASLDIGFVRSNSQVGCLEVHADYSRGHVALYSALYTSLSTGYSLELDNESAQSLPLGDPDKKWKETTPSTVTLRKTIAKRLEGFQVQSNSTGMLHSEMMIDLNGSFFYQEDKGQWAVQNGTSLSLSEAAIVRRDRNAQLQFAWIGDLESGSETEKLKWQSIDKVDDAWEQSMVLRSENVAEELWSRLKPFYELSDQGPETVQIGVMRSECPSLDEKWDRFTQQISRRYPPMSQQELEETMISYKLFREVILDMTQTTGVNVSGIFRQVTDNLELARGETRLMAITNQPIGRNEFRPESTQTQRQTLVVVHLARPDLPKAEMDIDSIEDYTGKSDLDWQQQDEELDQMTEDLMGLEKE
ncbi:MAG: hypothetical protein AAGA30_04560, partial [Planctomycetota bacterium]